MNFSNQYLPVDPDFIEKCQLLCKNQSKIKIHYFENNAIEQALGDRADFVKNKDGEFLSVGETLVRLDRIITLNGRPGPAYEEYDRYANACLTCEDLGQF